MNVFVDTSIVNNLLELNEHRKSNQNWEADARYLKLIIESKEVTLYVNPSVKQQIENTHDEILKVNLLEKFKGLHYTEFNLTIFPFHFPAKFLSEEQKAFIQQLCTRHPALLRDQKIIADAAFNDNIDVLLTTDKKLAHQVRRVGKVKFLLPKELYEDLTKLNS
ncbi:MAG: hypothetical protein Q8O05_01805 [Chloroflexota bacterium]|nr:hypothetical protein [Chloroflexota bacterium]